MAKTCKVCKKEKAYTEFYKCASTADKHQSSCKKCASERNKAWKRSNPNKRENIHKRWRDKKISRGHWVYLLPEENYVGVTHFWEAREMDHRSKGKNTDGFRLLYHTQDREEAYELETFLHDMGYEGMHSQLKYVRR